MDRKYDATYHLDNNFTNMVDSPLTTEEDLQRRFKEFHYAIHKVWNSIPVEDHLKVNEKCSTK